MMFAGTKQFRSGHKGNKQVCGGKQAANKPGTPVARAAIKRKMFPQKDGDPRVLVPQGKTDRSVANVHAQESAGTPHGRINLSALELLASTAQGVSTRAALCQLVDQSGDAKNALNALSQQRHPIKRKVGQAKTALSKVQEAVRRTKLAVKQQRQASSNPAQELLFLLADIERALGITQTRAFRRGGRLNYSASTGQPQMSA